MDEPVRDPPLEDVVTPKAETGQVLRAVEEQEKKEEVLPKEYPELERQPPKPNYDRRRHLYVAPLGQCTLCSLSVTCLDAGCAPSSDSA